MPIRVRSHDPKRRHFIKQWRKHRGYTQGQLAEMVGTSIGNLSRVETFQQPYTEDLLDLLADALATDKASLIMRDPTQPEGIWSIWDQASPGQKAQIVEVAKALLKTGS